MLGAIPSDLEQFVEQQVATGQYRSQDEVVVAGLQVLREVKRRQAEFQQQVRVGVDQLDRGEGIRVAANELRAFFDDIQARGQQRYEASKEFRA
jgi:putative addiction module CopG family antidote